VKKLTAEEDTVVWRDQHGWAVFFGSWGWHFEESKSAKPISREKS
jgi:hypothetical protein